MQKKGVISSNKFDSMKNSNAFELLKVVMINQFSYYVQL